MSTAWASANFDSLQALVDWLCGHRMEGPHDEIHEGQWGLTTAFPTKHPGYEATVCFHCGQPTLRAKGFADTRCGRWGCREE